MKYTFLFLILLFTYTANAQYGERKIQPLTQLKKSKGKYPFDIKLLTGSVLTARIKKLVGSDFKYLNDCQVQTPIKIENDLLTTTGCQPHMCPDKRYVLAYNFKTDALSIYFINLLNGNNKYALYSEDGIFPKELMEE